jgi:hypothetical protein
MPLVRSTGMSCGGDSSAMPGECLPRCHYSCREGRRMAVAASQGSDPIAHAERLATPVSSKTAQRHLCDVDRSTSVYISDTYP